MDCELFVRLIKEWNRGVCLFGAGESGRTWGYDLCVRAGFDVRFYCDNNRFGENVNGLQVHSADYLMQYKDELYVFICVFGENGLIIKKQLQDMKVCNILWICEGMPENELLRYLEEHNEKKLLKQLDPVIGDEAYIKRWYEKRVGYKLDLCNPETFNEKIQWIKLNDRNELYSLLVDKFEVKDYVRQKIGEQYIIPTIGVFNSFDDINFSMLPSSFVVKCTHDSGSIVKCTNIHDLNYEQLRTYFQTKLGESEYYSGREWSYKNVKPRIIIEEMIGEIGTSLKDYKVHCFGGKPMFIQVIGDRDLEAHTAKQLVYDFDWQMQTWCFGDYPRFSQELKKPDKLEELYDLAASLCEGIRYVRLDFYVLEDGIKFGEFTFYPLNGCYLRNEDWTYEADKLLGNMIAI